MRPSPHADMEHPVVIAAIRAVRVGGAQRFGFDAESEAEIERALLAHADDDRLPRAVVGLYGLATAFRSKERSPRAAKALIELLTRLAPRLPALSAPPAAQPGGAAFGALTLHASAT